MSRSSAKNRFNNYCSKFNHEDDIPRPDCVCAILGESCYCYFGVGGYYDQYAKVKEEREYRELNEVIGRFLLKYLGIPIILYFMFLINQNDNMW